MGGYVFLVVMCFIVAHAGSSLAKTNKECITLTSTVQNETDVSFNFTVADECVKDVVFISVFTPTSQLYCHFTHEKSVCDISSRLDTCACDPKTRSYSVVKDLSGLPEDQTEWLLKGASEQSTTLFEKAVNLPIKNPPEVFDIQLIGDRNITTKGEITVNEHSSLKFICSWNPGKPPRDAQLVKDGVLLIRQQPSTSQRTSQMEFAVNDIGCQDGGIYSCEAAGAVRNQSIQVIVHCTETTHGDFTETPTESASERWYSSEEIRQTTTATGVAEPDANNSKFDNNTIIYISFGCIFFLMIVIAILCGIVGRRKAVSAPIQQPPPVPIPDDNAIELQQLPATHSLGNRVSTLSYASDIYQEIKDDSSSDGWPDSEFESESQWSTPAAPQVEMTDTDVRTKRLILEQMAANNRRRARHCRPPLDEAPPVLPDSAHSAVKLPVLSDCDYFHPTASEEEKAHSSKADCTCFEEDGEGAAGGVCPHMARLCNPRQKSLGTDMEPRHRRQQRVPSKQAGLSRIRYHDDDSCASDMRPLSYRQHTLQPSLGAMSSHTGPPIEVSAHRTFSTASSTDSDGYMRPRPAVLPPRPPLDTVKRLVTPKHRQVMVSDRPQGTLKTSNSSFSNANTASGQTCPACRPPTPLKRSSVSGENTASGESFPNRRPTPLERSDVSDDNTSSVETCRTRRPTPLKRSGVPGASVKPQPHQSDVVEGTTGGYTRMTRPKMVTSISHSCPHTNLTSNAQSNFSVHTNVTSEAQSHFGPHTNVTTPTQSHFGPHTNVTTPTQSHFGPHTNVTTLTQSHSDQHTNVTSTDEPVAYANTEYPSDSADNPLVSVVTPPLDQDEHPPCAPRHDDDHPYENIDDTR